MNIVLCISETLKEFKESLVDAVCEVQLKKGLEEISWEQMSSITIAYEPVWAIGTGKVATPEIAQSVHKSICGILEKMYNSSVTDSIRIWYGDSLSANSIDGLLAQPDVDSGLVGGASLDSSSFGRIINFEGADVLVV